VSGLKLDVATPERVAVELPVAGIGYRMMAYLIDAGLLFAVFLVLYFFVSFFVAAGILNVVRELGQAAKITLAVGFFFAIWGYWTVLEVVWNGQTVGKRLLRIRVVRADGSPITAFESAVRNLLRFVDFLPSCYPVGLITMLVDRRHRRLGDLVAGTILIREETFDLSKYEKTGGSSARVLSAADVELVSGFLQRFDALEAGARTRLGAQLAARVGAATPPADDAALKALLEGALGGASASEQPLPAFVKRRRPEWAQLEALLGRQRAGQLALAEIASLDRLYRRASADLAHAQAFFPATDVHRHLNQLCADAYRAIYRRRGDRLHAALDFYRRGFPRAVRDNLPFVGVAAALLALGVVLGVTTVLIEPGGADLLVSDTLAHVIRRRELWTDTALEGHTPFEMAAMIFTNNVRVMIAAFALGVTGGVGTVVVMLANGVTNGAVVAMCSQYGLAGGLLEFMAAHGPVELSVICIAGGAGLIIGHAMIVPQERPRGEVLRERASVAVQLVLGCAPFLVGIGFVEGFVSPGALFPWWAKLVLGLSLGFAFWSYLLKTGREIEPAPRSLS